MELKSHIKNCQSKSRFLQKYYCLPAVCGVVEKMKAKNPGDRIALDKGSIPTAFPQFLILECWRTPGVVLFLQQPTSSSHPAGSWFQQQLGDRLYLLCIFMHRYHKEEDYE